MMVDSTLEPAAQTAAPEAAPGPAVAPGWRAGLQRALSSPGVLLVGLAAAAALVYANSLLNGFALDDVYIIQGNQRVHNLSGLRSIWLTPYWPFLGTQLGIYRPLAIFLYAVQWAVGGGAPWFFHAVNVLLHAGVTLLLFFLLRRLTATIPAAVGALIFAVHPVHTEAVANVVGQAELLAAAAILGACLVHSGRPTGLGVSWPRRVALLGLFLAGMCVKESVIVLPALLILLDLVQRRVALTWRGIAQYADAMAMPLLLLVLAFGGYLIVRFEVLDGALLGVDAGPQLAFLKEHRLVNAFRAFPEFARLLFFPQELSADYSPAIVLPVETLTPRAATGLLLLLGMALLTILTPWFPVAGFPAAWFIITISTVSNLAFPVGVLVAERTLYLPSVAVSALAAFAWQRLALRVSGRDRRLVQVAFAAAIVALAARTFIRNPDWASTQSLLQSAVRDHPESYRSQWTIAASYSHDGDDRRAALHFEAAYRTYARDSEFLAEYGNFWLGQRRWQRGVDLLETAYEMHPFVLRSTTLLGYGYLGVGRYQDALRLIQRAEELRGALAVTMPMRAYAFERLNDPDRAAAAWRVAVQQPGTASWLSWSFLARTLAMGGHDEPAREALGKARSVVPAEGRAILTRLESAVSAGCYRNAGRGSAAGQQRADGSRSTLPACDPLGDWLDYAVVQSATSSQNATPPTATAPGAEARSTQ